MRPVLACLLAPVLLAGCTTQEPAPEPDPADVLEASITQFRHDEGTRNLRAGVTNVGTSTATVTRATLAWHGFMPTSVEIEPWTLEPGRTAGFTLAYGDARCEHAPGTRPRLDVVVDGREHRLPLMADDADLLDRLYRNECAAQRLGDAGSVALELADTPIELAGAEYLPGDVVLRRRPGSTADLAVVDVGGSVLLRLTPRRDTGALPARLATDQRELRLPVLIGSAHRCDAHALGNSSQTFLLSVYLRLDDQPVQRVITVPDRSSRALLARLISRDCH